MVEGAPPEYVAALCLNLGVPALSLFTVERSTLVATGPARRDAPWQGLRDCSGRELREAIEAAGAERSTAPDPWRQGR